MAAEELTILDDEFTSLDAEEFEIDGEPEEGEPFEYDDLEPNLVETFMSHPIGREALKKISSQVDTDFTTAWDNSEDYRERTAEDWNLFLGKLKEKTFPYDGCANPHVPIMFEVLTRVHARAMSELFGDWTNVFGVLPINPDDEDVAEVISKHDNWQIHNVITDFKRQQHRGVLLFLCQGDVVSHSYYDMARRRNCHDILTCDEVVMPYVYTSTEPDLSDMPFVIHIFSYYRHELQAIGYDSGWHDIEKVLSRDPPGFLDEVEQAWRQAAAEIEGIEEGDDSPGVYKILHYEGWTRHLPGQDRDRYVKVIFDKNTRAILHLSIHEEENWQDRLRYERQLEELMAYQTAMEQHEQFMAQLENRRAFLDQELQDPLLMGPLREQREVEAAAVSAEAPAPPEPPDWMVEGVEGPEPPRMEPIRLFARGVCIEPIVGNLGHGYGRMLADMNTAANVALAQFTDAATFGNSKSIITAGIEFDRPFECKPGHINKAKGVSGNDIRQSIHELNMGPANPQLVEVVNMMVEAARTSVQAPEVLSGEPGKSGETYRGISARIEQATKQLSVTTRKYADFLEQILRNNAKLNAVYLPEDEVVEIYDPKLAKMKGLRIGRQMWERDYRVQIRADLRFASQAQRIQEADEVVQMGQHPILMQNFEFQRRALVKALEARGENDMAQLVEGMQPPMPAAPGSAPPDAPQGGPAGPGALAPPSPGESVPPPGSSA